MTKVQNPIIGRASKQAGGMVFSTVYGKNVMRSKPFEINDKKTPRRERQRAKFKAGNELASKVKSYLQMIYPNSPLHFSKYNLLVRECISSLVFDDPVWVFNPVGSVIGNGTLAFIGGSYGFQDIIDWVLYYQLTSPYVDTLNGEYDDVFCFITDVVNNTNTFISGTYDNATHRFNFTIPPSLYDATVLISNPVLYRGLQNNATKLNLSIIEHPVTLVGNL